MRRGANSKIGRASCRERVCSTVYISVVAVSLKKFFFKQKTAYEITWSDWSSDVCSSDLSQGRPKLAIFVDHNVAESSARAFESAGHRVRRLRHTLPPDAPDDLVAATAAAAGEILLTHDKDFRQVARRAGSGVVHPKKMSIKIGRAHV